MPETHTDPDCQTIVDLTNEWMQCVATKNTARVEELLTEDFIYSRHPKFGRETLTKREIIAFMPSIEASETKIVEQYMRKIGDVIVVHNLTRANQKVAASAEEAGNASFLNKRLIDSSAWRRDDGVWRCFDYRLIDALD